MIPSFTPEQLRVHQVAAKAPGQGCRRTAGGGGYRDDRSAPVADQVPMPVEDPLTRLQDATALWSIRQCTAAEVIEAACDCLVAGVDSPSLRILAGVSPSAGSQELIQWLEPALDELGLTYLPQGSQVGEDAAVRVMASRLLAGALTPRELARWAPLGDRTRRHAARGRAGPARRRLRHAGVRRGDRSGHRCTRSRRGAARDRC